MAKFRMAPLDQNGEVPLTHVFETPELLDEADLLGFPVFTADVSSDAPQANLAATLSAVARDGTATLISFGALNLAHRDSDEEPTPLTPGQSVKIRLQLNACGQHIAPGQKLRLTLSTSYWPIIWPSQSKATLSIRNAQLDLPARPPRDEDADLAPFLRPESATPVEAEMLSEGAYERVRTMDYVTGHDVYERIGDSGAIRYPHIDMTTRDQVAETFSIHPDDPNSAKGHCHWVKTYSREGWRAKVDATITVEALADIWRIRAHLVATDGDDVVADREWSEDIPRDHV